MKKKSVRAHDCKATLGAPFGVPRVDLGNFHEIDMYTFLYDDETEEITHYTAYDVKAEAWTYKEIGDNETVVANAVFERMGWGCFVNKMKLADMLRREENRFISRWGKRWAFTDDQENAPLDADMVAEVLDSFGGGLRRTGLAGGVSFFIRDLIELPRKISRWLIPDKNCPPDGGDVLLVSESFLECTKIVARCYETVSWWGRRLNCRAEALEVVGTLGEVVRWLELCAAFSQKSLLDLAERVKRCNAALHAMALAVLRGRDLLEAEIERAKAVGDAGRGNRGKRGHDTAVGDVRVVNQNIYQFWKDHKKENEKRVQFWNRCKKEKMWVSGILIELGAACNGSYDNFKKWCENGGRRRDAKTR